jgi:hypothetical protein
MDKATEGSIMTTEEGRNLGGPCDDFAMILYKSIMGDSTLSTNEKLIMCYVRGFDSARKLCYANSKTMGAKFGMADCLVRKIRSDLVAKKKLFKGETKVAGRKLPVFSTYPTTCEVCVSDTQPDPEPCVIHTPKEEFACVPHTPPVCSTHTSRVSDTQQPCVKHTHNNNYNNNYNKNHKSDHAREGATSATSESFLKKEKEGEQPRKLSNQQQMEQNYKAGQRSIAEIDAQIRAEGRDPDAKMPPEVAKQKFAELMATLARRKSS